MKANAIVLALWAGLAGASVCKPSKPASVSSVSSLPSSSTLPSSTPISSSSSLAPSSLVPSSSVVPSSSSLLPSSSSAAPSATPDPNIAAGDSNIAANPNRRWNYGGNAGSMVATTCDAGDPTGSCLVYTLSSATFEDFLMYILYSTPTLVQGTSYTWSFEAMRDPGNGGSISFQIVDPNYNYLVNDDIDVTSFSTTGWTPLSYTFTASSATGISIQYSMYQTPGSEDLKFKNFQLIAA